MNNAEHTPKVDLVVTSDGSHTLKLKDADEHYHSTHGALQESQHVFIKNGLDLFATHEVIDLLEVGFGTGANALLTELWSRSHNGTIAYDALETYPLPNEVTGKLNYSESLELGKVDVFQALHDAEWGHAVPISPKFRLLKQKRSILDLDAEQAYDLIYFDAFGPRTQPELWTLEVFDILFHACRQGGVLVTYCAKGQVRRDLLSTGFDVERLPGRPGKREMLRAIRP